MVLPGQIDHVLLSVVQFHMVLILLCSYNLPIDSEEDQWIPWPTLHITDTGTQVVLFNLDLITLFSSNIMIYKYNNITIHNCDLRYKNNLCREYSWLHVQYQEDGIKTQNYYRMVEVPKIVNSKERLAIKSKLCNMTGFIFCTKPYYIL